MYTSKNTSVNSKRVPKGLSLLYPYGNVLDYGAGKYWNINKDYCMKKGATSYTSYDPYNIKDNINLDDYKGYFDTIYCTNVLNVIYDSYNVVEIIEKIADLLAVDGLAIFTMYEGDRSGIGKETKPDCWQRNSTTNSYMWFFEYAKTRYCLIEVKAGYIKMRKLSRSDYYEVMGIMEKPF